MTRVTNSNSDVGLVYHQPDPDPSRLQSHVDCKHVCAADYWSFCLAPALVAHNLTQPAHTTICIFFNLRVNLTPKVFIVPCLSYHHIMLLLSFLIMNCLLFWVKQPDNPRVCINTKNCNYNWTVKQFKVHCLDGQSFNLTCVQPRKTNNFVTM